MLSNQYLQGEVSMKYLRIIVCCSLALAMISCENMRGRDIGTVAGAGIGAAAGSQIGSGAAASALGAAGGAVAGGVAGHYIGKSMEKK